MNQRLKEAEDKILDLEMHLRMSRDCTAELRAEIERLTEEHGKACRLVAKMHFAATGSTDGPKRGVSEDVEDLRLKFDMCRAALERIDRMSSFAERGSLAGVVAKDALREPVA